jgi:hypothetical protein
VRLGVQRLVIYDLMEVYPMNIENLNKLLAHVDQLDSPLPDWSPSYCLSGMATEIQGFEFEDQAQSLSEFLGISPERSDDLIYRRSHMRFDMHDIGNLPLDVQKRAITHALTSLRDTGKVEWIA